MGPSKPGEPDPRFTEPDGIAYDASPFRWNTTDAEGTHEANGDVPVVDSLVSFEDAEPANPGIRRAAFGAILGVVAILVGVLAQLADFGVLVWLAVAAFLMAVVMIGLGYREWRADADR